MRATAKWSYALSCLLLLGACKSKPKPQNKKEAKMQPISAPDFNADSAYLYVQKQVEFGPRVPNTEPHYKCGDYLIQKLTQFGAKITIQSFGEEAFDGTVLQLRNIIASFYPKLKKRVLLGAHWDTRPFADKDSTNKSQPIDGANDGASGVGVLLEIARQIQQTQPKVGVDIILFDGEDFGAPLNYTGKILEKFYQQSDYCLGSKYWAENKHQPNYRAYCGILLDMVGAKNAKFYQEQHSLDYAPSVVKAVWDIANQKGYSDFFKYDRKSGIMDDHIYVNEIAKIPMINIIELEADQTFGWYHHTHADNMDIIDKNTLKAAGQTVLYYIFSL